MDREKLKSLTENSVIDKLYVEEEVTSTNDVAKSMSREGFKGRALIVSELQTKGRGRLGRNWSSPAGTGIWMSLLDTDTENLVNIPGITLLAGLAVAEALNSLSGEECARIKWPNDVVINGKKVCGILTELISSGTESTVIIGIGINASMDEFPEELKDKATSVFLEIGQKPEREKIITGVVTKLTEYISAYKITGSLGFAMDRYHSLMVNKGKEVILSSANGDFYDNPYIATGIDEEGNLLVEDKSGTVHTVQSGEISVRGVLGYV